VGPRPLFAKVAQAEAVTWALLLVGMFLKYVTETTELGVQVFGMLHGIVFVAYVVVCLAVALDQRWSPRLTLVGLAAAVPPFATVAFDTWVERRDRLNPGWRLLDHEPERAVERPLAWLVRHPLPGLATLAAAVAGLTALALVVGPPA